MDYWTPDLFLRPHELQPSPGVVIKLSCRLIAFVRPLSPLLKVPHVPLCQSPNRCCNGLCEQASCLYANIR